MRIVRAKFGYQQEFTEAQKQEINTAILFDSDRRHWEVIPDKEGLWAWGYWYAEVTVDLDKLPIYVMGREFAVTEHCNYFHKSLSVPVSREATVVNQKVNVAVPGFGLMAIRQVDCRYDLCTDELRRMLDDGWQILAICPQPDQRRPDYVLGKPAEKELE